MRRLFPILILLGLLVGVNSSHAENKNGAIKFSPTANQSASIAMGQAVKLNATLNFTKVGAISAVSVRGNVNNTASVKMYYSYSVAFLDKDKNLVGCQNFNLFLDPGKTGFAGTFIQIPPAQIARIAYYSAAFDESDQPIGQK